MSQAPFATPATDDTADRADKLRPYRPFLWALAGLFVLYAWPLLELLRLSLKEELYSHVFLIPVASGYLIWQIKDQLPGPSNADRVVASIAGLGALGLLAFYVASLSGWGELKTDDMLAISTSSFVLAVITAAAWFLGRPMLKVLAFPLGCLVFMIPMPHDMMTAIETALQHGSAATAHAIFEISGMPVFRESTLFMLPGFSLEVAPECSGIRSSLALFITSTFAGYLFLRSPWKRIVLSVAVIPLALLRNGFRVWVIGELCVKVSPDMIDSFIHHHGGPIFFALSLIPFSALLYVLMRMEKRRSA